MSAQIPDELVPIAVKLWLDMQTGKARGLLKNVECRCELSMDCPVCGRDNRLVMYVFSDEDGGAVQIECTGIAPFCPYFVNEDVITLTGGLP